MFLLLRKSNNYKKACIIMSLLVMTSTMSDALFAVANETKLKLKVMCFNIHHGEGTDGVYDLERLANVINDADVDVVMLQEVDKLTRRSGKVDQAEEIAKLTKMYHVFGETIKYDGGLYGNAILSKKPIKNYMNYKLPRPNKKEQRAVLLANIKYEDRLFSFASTHLQHTHLGSRMQQVEWINENLNDDNIPVVMSGDFNAEVSDQAIKALDEEWLRLGKDKKLFTFPAVKPSKSIDHIYLRNFANVKCLKQWVVDSGKASDHRPLIAELEIDLAD